MQRRLKILTWHTHGSYLYYLTQAPHDFYVLSKPGRPAGYGGRGGHIPWGDNVYDMPVDDVRNHEFDCIIFQDDHQYLRDQHDFLSDAQRRLPKIYIEHDCPRQNPTDERHPVDDPDVLLVHVTPFNALMWDSGRTPRRVVEHGVKIPSGIEYNGELARGLVVVNNIATRGRRLGGDIFADMRDRVPLDLVGMGAQEIGGLGEVQHDQLPAFSARYRFFFNPIRYTSLGLAVIEAMMVGLPVVALATTETATVIQDGVRGFASNDPAQLADRMRMLLADRGLAQTLGAAARSYANERFGIDRFARDWDAVIRDVAA